MSKKFIDLEGLKAYHDKNVEALNDKVNKTGGTITGNLEVTGYVNASDGISVVSDHGNIILNSVQDNTSVYISDGLGTTQIGPSNIFISAADGNSFEISPDDGYFNIVASNGEVTQFNFDQIRRRVKNDDVTNEYNYTYPDKSGTLVVADENGWIQTDGAVIASDYISANELYIGPADEVTIDPSGININQGEINIDQGAINVHQGFIQAAIYDYDKRDEVYVGLTARDLYCSKDGKTKYEYALPDKSGTLVVKDESGRIDIITDLQTVNTIENTSINGGGYIGLYDGKSLYYSPNGDDEYEYTLPEKSGTLVVTDENGIISTDNPDGSTTISPTYVEMWNLDSEMYTGMTYGSLYYSPNGNDEYTYTFPNKHGTLVVKDSDGFVGDSINVGSYNSGYVCMGNNYIEVNDNDGYVGIQQSRFYYSPDGEVEYTYAYPEQSGTLVVANSDGRIDALYANNVYAYNELSVGPSDDVYIESTGITLNEGTGITLDGIKLDTVAKVDDYDANSESQIATTAVVAKMIQNGGQGSDVSGEYLPIEGGTIDGHLTVVGSLDALDGMSARSIWTGELCIGDSDEIILGTYEDAGGYRGYFGLNGTSVTHIGTSDTHGVSDNELVTSKAVDEMIPDYYMHTISINKIASGTCAVSFMVLSKSATEFTAATLYSTYGNKAIAASGYYGSNVVSKLAFTSSTQCRFVHGSTPSTGIVTITELTDTVIPV